ncbi:unnamed protein product [Rangifer tarandus platyrhynchus]|uniref:Uncharacterized protein n=2 Tax=Rangifer tarandus platyrhynchus TaxID=3082113 RepID=A0AC60A8G9_RANTA|nr:unnamed protein product [Rangifer tarandus platyrhynchus]
MLRAVFVEGRGASFTDEPRRWTMTYMTYSRGAKRGAFQPKYLAVAIETQALVPRTKMEELPFSAVPSSCLCLQVVPQPGPSSLKGRGQDGEEEGALLHAGGGEGCSCPLPRAQP